MEHKVRYAIGDQDFESIRARNCVYIDKTCFIDKIIDDGSLYFFLARPRRFGKSLFLSTLRYFYEGRRDLFKGLYIDSIDWDWTEYPVLRLDLNIGDYSVSGNLEIVLETYLREWEKKYEIAPFTTDFSTRFRHVIEEAHRTTGRKVVVLVDEYDKPLVRNLNSEDNFEHYRAKLAALYSNFKSSAEHIQLVFLTGVSRFSKLSVFSDLNNINDITFDNKFADVCGITTEELQSQLRIGIESFAKKQKITEKEAENLLAQKYDGYKFTKYGSDIYNPWSLLNCLSKGEPEFFWNETGLPTIVAETLKRINANLEEMFDVHCSQEELKGLDLLNPNPTALLFQTGYLTIKDYDSESNSYHLGIPNKEVKKGLFNVLVPYYVKNRSVPGNRLINDVVRNFMFGDPDKAMKNLQTYFAGIDYALRIENENNFHNALYLLLDLIGLDTTAESHTSAGRIDLEIKTRKYVYIIELKYDHTSEEALRQIEKQHYARKYQMEHREVILIGVSFSSKSRCIEDWIIKRNYNSNS